MPVLEPRRRIATKTVPCLYAAALCLSGGAAAQTLEEVVVTAEKRQETAQEVANPMTVFSGEDVRSLGVTEPRDLAAQTPGLLTKVGPNGLATIGFYMRGVGINDFTGTVDSSVGVYVDEVFKATPDMFNFGVFDVERVEVLKGPQGTLYGRNSTGGAVNFISAAPTRHVEGYARAGYQRFQTGTLEAALSGPLTDELLGRIAFSGRVSSGDEGYSFNRLTDNRLGDDDRAAVRAQLHWLPREDFDVRLIYTYGHQESEPPLLEHVGATDLVNGGICAPVIAGRRAEGPCTNPLGFFDADGDRFDGAADTDPSLDIDAHNITAKLNWELPRFTVTAITGYDDFEKDQTQDIDASPFAIGNNETVQSQVEAFSQEVRLTSDESWPFTWILGAFYFDSEIDWFQTIDLSDLAIPTSNGADQSTESWAVFGDVKLPVGERFELEGGVRFTHEERVWEGASVIGTFESLEGAFDAGAPVLSALPIPAGGTVGGDMPGGPQDFDNSLEENNVDFRAAVKYHHNDDLMAYFSVSEGFRSGGVSSAVIFSQAAVEPFDVESLRAYEVGFKSRLLGGRAQFNASGFFYDFEDYQATFVRDTEVSARLQNAGDVEIYGAEVSLRWLVTERLLVDGGFSWLENEIVETDVVLPPLDGSAPATIEGNEIANAPQFSFNGRARYEFPSVYNWSPALQFDFTYVDDHFLEPNNRRVLEEDGYFLLNGRLTLLQGAGEGNWEVHAWVKNLTDAQYLTAAQDVMLALGLAERVQGAPRTFSVEIGYSF